MATKTSGRCSRAAAVRRLQHGKGAREHADRLGQAGHGESLEVADQTRARRGQSLAAEAEDLRGGLATEDLGDQRARVQITGRLAARDHDAHRCGTGQSGC